MVYWVLMKMLVLGMLVLCVRKVACKQARGRGHYQTSHLDVEPGSGFGLTGLDEEDFPPRGTILFDDSDESTSGWDASGDIPADDICSYTRSRHIVGGNLYLSVAPGKICRHSGERSRRKCVQRICQCFPSGSEPTIHLEDNFSIQCNPSLHARTTRPTPKTFSTFVPTNESIHFDPSDYDGGDDDDEDDNDDDDYSVEIDRSRVTQTELEKQRSRSILNKPSLLASILGGTIIALLCAVLLVMFIVYRVKKNRGSPSSSPPYDKTPPACPPLKGYTKNFVDCDVYA